MAVPEKFPDGARLRIDKWLWHARFFKSRTLSAKLAASGKLRVGAPPLTQRNDLSPVCCDPWPPYCCNCGS